MSVLTVDHHVEFNALKELLDLTDGNLASHLKALEKEKYLTVEKVFVSRKPKTTYSITESGRKAFQEHLDALEDFIKSM